MTDNDIRKTINAFRKEYKDGTIEEFKIWPFNDYGHERVTCTVMMELASKYSHTDERYKEWARNLLHDTNGTLKDLQKRLNASQFAGGIAGQHRLFFEFYIEEYNKED